MKKQLEISYNKEGGELFRSCLVSGCAAQVIALLLGLGILVVVNKCSDGQTRKEVIQKNKTNTEAILPTKTTIPKPKELWLKMRSRGVCR